MTYSDPVPSLDEDQLIELGESVFSKYSQINSEESRKAVCLAIQNKLDDTYHFKECPAIVVKCDEENNPASIVESRQIVISLMPKSPFGELLLRNQKTE